MNIAYICDGRAPCAGREGCCFGDPLLAACTRTTNPIFAKHGACAHPEEHPERFKVVGADQNEQPVYIEMEEGGAQSGIHR